MQSILDLEELSLHNLNLLSHALNPLVSLLYQLSQLLYGAILFHDVYLHDLVLFLVLADFAQVVRLVSFLSLSELVDLTLHIAVLLHGVPDLLFSLVLGLLDLLAHLVLQTALELGLFPD
mmetsp:Transcript_43279/g.57258  ORF Transcript_43279/g.57258 Transcript_43279/m.57258 type:complete len:120 (-) Transcript_43279:2366-2725(-)